MRLNSAENTTFGVVESVDVSWLALNTERPPLNNVNIRKSLVYAINSKKITGHVFQSGGKPALGIFNGELTFLGGPYSDDDNETKEHFEKSLKELGMTRVNFPLTPNSLKNFDMARDSCLVFYGKLPLITPEKIKNNLTNIYNFLCNAALILVV